MWPRGCASLGRFGPCFGVGRGGRGGGTMNGRKPSSLAAPTCARRGKSGPKGDATSERIAKTQVELRNVLAPSRALLGGRCRCDFQRAHTGKTRNRRIGAFGLRLAVRRLPREEPGRYVAREEIVRFMWSYTTPG